MTYQTPATRILGFILSVYMAFMITGCEPVDDDSVGSAEGALSAEGLDIDVTECVTVKFGDDTTCKPEKAWVFYADTMSADRGLEMVRYRLGEKCGDGGFVGIKFMACPMSDHDCGVEDDDTVLEKPDLGVVPFHPIKKKPVLDDDSDNVKPDWNVIAGPVKLKIKPALNDDAPIKIKPVTDDTDEDAPIKIKPALNDDAPIKIKPVTDDTDEDAPIKIKPALNDDAPIKIKPVTDDTDEDAPIKIKPALNDDAPIKIKPAVDPILPIKVHTKPEPVKPELDFEELDLDEDGDESNLGADIEVIVEASEYFVAVVSELHQCTDGKELMRRARFVCKSNKSHLVNFGLYQGRCAGPTSFDSMKFTCAALH